MPLPRIPSYGDFIVCELCRELEARIDQCRRLEMKMTDQATLDGIALLISGYEADMSRVHDEPQATGCDIRQ